MKLREQAKKKLKKQGGFTLIEMLIVVAIIAILVAVAIPVVTSALSKTKDATDEANERSAKAAALTEFLANGNGTATENTVYYFNATTGGIATSAEGITGYGQCSYHKDGILKVTVTTKGEATVEWTKGAGTHLAGTVAAEAEAKN